MDSWLHLRAERHPTWPHLTGPRRRIVNPNYYTIGIEHEGRADDPWSDTMYATSAALLADIAQRHPALKPLTRNNVVKHRDIRASKSCPGNTVDLTRLILAAGGAIQEDPQVLPARSRVNVRRASRLTVE